MAEPVTFRVGQKLWFVQADSRRGSAFEVTIEKIGREYAHVRAGIGWHMRFKMDPGGEEERDPPRWRVDGGQYSSPGTLWLSQDAYEADRDLRAVWHAFQRRIDRMRRGPPPGVSIATIHRIAAILGVTGKKEED